MKKNKIILATAFLLLSAACTKSDIPQNDVTKSEYLSASDAEYIKEEHKDSGDVTLPLSDFELSDEKPDYNFADIWTTEDFDTKTKKFDNSSKLEFLIRNYDDGNISKEKGELTRKSDTQNDWYYHTPSFPSAQTPAISDMKVKNGNIYFKEDSTLVCLDRKSGKITRGLWGAGHGGSYIMDGDNIYSYGAQTQYFAVYGKEGNVLFDKRNNNNSHIEKLTATDGRIYMKYENLSDGLKEFDIDTMKMTGFEVTAEENTSDTDFRSYTVYGVNNGEVLWKFATTPVNVKTYYLNFNIMADKYNVYVITNNVVTVLDKTTGKKLWVSGDIGKNTVQVIDNDNFYYSSGKNIVAVNKLSGEQLWTVNFEGCAKIVLSDGYLCASEQESGNFVVSDTYGNKITCGNKQGYSVEDISEHDGKLTLVFYKHI